MDNPEKRIAEKQGNASFIESLLRIIDRQRDEIEQLKELLFTERNHHKTTMRDAQ
jgi:predicted CopG family antitoxin